MMFSILLTMKHMFSMVLQHYRNYLINGCIKKENKEVLAK